MNTVYILMKNLNITIQIVGSTAVESQTLSI